LDRETKSSYSFDAVATDSCLYGPRRQTVRVDIAIQDVNDNSPEFDVTLYSADILLDMPVGGLVTSVSATDRDSGLNARLTYSLDTSVNSYFQVSFHSVSKLNTNPKTNPNPNTNPIQLF